MNYSNALTVHLEKEYLTVANKLTKKAYYKNFKGYIGKNKLWIIILVILGIASGALFGIRGMRSYNNISEEQKSHHQEYEDALKSYEDAITQAETNISVTETQISEQQRYNDNSIYMKLDPQNIYVSSIQYVIHTQCDVNAIYSALSYFVSNGGAIEGLAEQYPDMGVEYWPEIIGISLNYNVMELYVLHYDAGQAEKIRGIIVDRIKEYKPDIVSQQGEFTLDEINKSDYTKADVNVLNVQNDKKNVLTNYQNTLVNYQNSLVSSKAGYETYIEENEADYRLPQKKTIVDVVKYAAAGGIGLGICIMLLLIVLYVSDSRMRDTSEISRLGLQILGEISCGEKNIECSVENIALICKRKDLNSIHMAVLTEVTDSIKDILVMYEEQLGEKGVKLSYSQFEKNDAESMSQIMTAGNIVTFCECGRTKYENIKRMVDFCKQYNIGIAGAVSVD